MFALSEKRSFFPLELVSKTLVGAAEVGGAVLDGLSDDEALPNSDGPVDEEVEGFPNRLNASEDGAPIPVDGGGPAGVVEFPKSDVVGLLVGVVDDALVEFQLKSELPPALLFPPSKTLGVWD